MPITLYLRTACAAQAAENWRKRFQTPSGNWFGRGDAGTIYQLLVALGPAPTPEAVEAIEASCLRWHLFSCDGCEAENVDTIQVGQALHYESATANLCATCLAEAYQTAAKAGMLPLP